MGLADVLLPLLILSLSYVLLFTVARSKENEELVRRRTRR